VLGTKVVPPDAQINLGGGTRDTLIPNLLGSIVGSYDSAGALTKFGYQPYGTGSPAPQFAYTGQRIDPETGGLYYYRARHYSTAFGRFLQPDPIGYGGGMHLYGYVENDPLGYRMVTSSGLGNRLKGELSAFQMSSSNRPLSWSRFIVTDTGTPSSSANVASRTCFANRGGGADKWTNRKLPMPPHYEIVCASHGIGLPYTRSADNPA